MISSTPRFFVALIPPVEIQDYAQQVIQELSDRYQTYTANAPPHITLQPPFQWSLVQAPELEQCLHMFASRWAAVPITFSGFGTFAPRILYMNVLRTPELLSLQAGLIAELEQTLGIIDPKAHRRPFSPHLTIASRNVTRETFDKAWTDLQVRPVKFEFVASCLTLLIHDGQAWQISSEYALLDSADTVPAVTDIKP
jgi:2'-5' RNA ligase